MNEGHRNVVVTGLGLLTPLGASAGEVLARLRAGEVAAAEPTSFDASAFACRLTAQIGGFRAEGYLGESKTLRLMNRDAQLAACAARLAVRDAGLRIGEDVPAESVALFGSTGMAALPAGEISRLVRHAAGADGSLDLRLFGEVALKRVRPVLSFKILSNMPLCFVSIFERIRGPNAVYTPWEGQGARAIAAAIRAVRRGEAPCALAGGCDVKTNEFAYLALQQQGVFASWQAGRRGAVPGEGAAFLVLEEQQHARRRGARVYARFTEFAFGSTAAGDPPPAVRRRVLGELRSGEADVWVGPDGNEGESPRNAGGRATSYFPKRHLGDLFAAAAAVQVAVAAAAVAQRPSPARAVAACFGHGTEQGAFALESA